jgi:hypothetical protein
LIDANGKTIQFIAAGTQPIHVLIDTLDVKSFPTNLRWLIHMIQNNETRADGWRVIIVNDSTIHVLVKTILSVLHKPIHSCSCVQEAHNFLKELETPSYALTS